MVFCLDIDTTREYRATDLDGIGHSGHFWFLWRTLYGRPDQPAIDRQRNNVSLFGLGQS